MLKPINIIPENTNINFIKHCKMLLSVSFIISIFSLILFFFKGPNYSIDFKGGILIEISFQQDPNIHNLRKILLKKFDDISIQNLDGNDVIIRLSNKNEKPQEIVYELQNILNNSIDSPFEYRKIDFVGPQIGQELFQDALFALILSFIAISIYLGYRFEWYYGVGTVISLIHDAALLLGFYAILDVDFNLTSIAAILTVIGYSVNDSVVIYDRIREYKKKYPYLDKFDLINKSINSTLSRTILTVLTTLVANIVLIFYGGEVVRSFSITVFIGIIIGTYSSIYISVPILLYLDKSNSKSKRIQ